MKKITSLTTGRRLALTFGAALLLVFLWYFSIGGVLVAFASGPPPDGPETPDKAMDNEECLSCHSRPGQELVLPSGEAISITVDPDAFGMSVHQDLTCTSCHSEVGGFPHESHGSQTLRDHALVHADTCQVCHEEHYVETGDSIHQELLEAGNQNAPTCADCHLQHAQQAVHEVDSPYVTERIMVAQVCAQCHSTIYEEYVDSVHGQGVAEDNNLDEPTCIDCHGVHGIANPLTAKFRLSSVEMCADCHTDPERMEKYELSTDVLNTYVADFHGTTVTLFEKQHPDELTNKAVCYDCHGVHNIKRTSDPEHGLHVKENMLAACQSCHPDADSSFPDSWMSHYIPSPEHYPLVYYVQQFYNLMIPSVLGGMVLFIGTDVYRRLVINRKKNKKTQEDANE
jgi:hypothetical protein